jgi:DNA-binding LytR/AlgR family response regulator
VKISVKVLIVENEAPAWKRLKKMLESLNKQIEVLDILESVEATVSWLKHQQTPDIIFMDIQLADGLSFEIFEKVEINAPVVFTTAFHEYTLQAFKVNSIDYLLKPIKEEELAQSIHKYHSLKDYLSVGSNKLDIENLLKSLQHQSKEYKSRFLVKFGERLLSIPVIDIAYFQADSKIVLLITRDNKKYAIDYSLDELELQLDPSQFYRLNRQFISGIHSIKNIFNYFNGKLKIQLQPETTEEVLVSREKSSHFKDWLDR